MHFSEDADNILAKKRIVIRSKHYKAMINSIFSVQKSDLHAQNYGSALGLEASAKIFGRTNFRKYLISKQLTTRTLGGEVGGVNAPSEKIFF